MNQLLLPRRVTLIEVGPRDGFQSIPYPLPSSLKIKTIQSLLKSGITNIQITSFVNPAIIPQFKDAEEVVAEFIGYPDPEVIFTGLVLNKKGLDRAIASGISGVEISISASDSFSKKNTGKGYLEALKEVSYMLSIARKKELYVRASIQCTFGTSQKEEMPLSQIKEILRIFLDNGVNEIVFADTASVAGPLEISKLLENVLSYTNKEMVSLHFHGDASMVLVNLYASLLQGITRFDTSFGGIGGCPFIKGAKQNLSTEEAIKLLSKLNIQTGINLSRLQECSRAFNEHLASLT